MFDENEGSGKLQTPPKWLEPLNCACALLFCPVQSLKFVKISILFFGYFFLFFFLKFDSWKSEI